MFVPNTTIQQLTGTLPLGGLPTGFTQVNLVRTGEIYPEQVRTLDVRLAKLFRGTTRTDVAIDLYNLFNTNKPVAYNQTFGFDGATWLQPTQIADARFARFNVTFSF